MDNKAFASLGLIKNNEKSSDNVFMNAIFEHALPSGFSFLTTTESGTFNPNDYCVNKSTWTYSEITVVSSNDSNVNIKLVDHTKSVSLSQGVSSWGKITASTISGYTFVGWVEIACDGFIANGYFQYPLSQTTNTYGYASYNMSGIMHCYAMYKKDITQYKWIKA